jgi:hypothetical protein
MTRGTFGWTASAEAATRRRRTLWPALALTVAMAAGAFAAGANGRYKKQGDQCLWDANDSGPNQCAPVTPGRFKKSGNACVWDGSDKGPDQCTPAKGRFKKERDACVWNATDSGPNQCDPRKTK